MKEDLEKVKLLTRDLREGKEYPRSPRETLGGYVLAARAVDKCRAVLAGWQGEYHSNCPLDQRWLKFAEIDYDAFRSFVATGATDEELAMWIGQHAKQQSRAEVIAWNNKERDLRLSDLPLETQEFMEDYIRKYFAQRTRRAMVEEYPHAGTASRPGALGAWDSFATKSSTSATCSRVIPSNQSRNSSTVAPALRLAKSVSTGTREALNTHLPPSFPGRLSTAGHFAQSIMLKK